jgi:uncharacterized phage protein gp47/JayE
MADYGLTSTGFVPKTLEVIREEINERMRAAFGASIDLSDGSIEGQIVAILAEREALLWEQMEVVNSSQDPDSATGTGLDALCALTGTVREVATRSLVTLTLTGTAATVVPSASRASTASTAVQFETLADGTLVALTAWAISTAYVVGDRRTNGGNAYVCTVAGTSAGAGGPSTTAPAIVDGSVTWRYIGAGAAAVDVAAQAVDTGPLVATSGDITEIETPVSGWDGVRNLLDATLGNDGELDEALRLRRELELAAAGASTPNAIRAALLNVDDVTSATVFINATDATDADGMPPHSVEALVRGGLDQDILDTLLDQVAAGILTHGTTTGAATDDEGTSHVVKFSRPDEIEIYVDVEVTVDANEYPTDGDAQVKAAIVAWGDALSTGRDAVASALIAQVFKVAGVLDVTLLQIGTVPAPSASTTIAIALRELATFDTSRITVVNTPGTP